MSSPTTVPTAPSGVPYEIRAVPGKGYGCFAQCPIKRGTRILADNPLLIVPIADYMLSDIQKVFDALTPEQQALYFSLHSGHGQDPRLWPSHIHPVIQGKEQQRIKEQHDARVGKSPSLISIFQTNCMEMNKGAAVFPDAARLNHNCNPNATFAWNPDIGKETIHAIRDICAGEEITISYCDMMHEKTLRSWELKHYGFDCDCRACAEDEDDETTFAHKSAERRFRLQDLDRDTRFLRGANLEKGANTEDFIQKLLQIAALHIQEGDWTSRLSGVLLDIALVCELKGDLKMAEKVAEKALEVKRDCQGEDFPGYEKYAAVLRRIASKAKQKGVN